jgi:hypothetical protein
MAIPTASSNITAAEARFDKLQKGGSYSKRGRMSRRWAMWYPIAFQSGVATYNPISAATKGQSFPMWLTNLITAQIPTGRAFLAERLKPVFVPYNIGTKTFLTAAQLKPSVLQAAKNLWACTYQKWGRLGASDGFDAEFAGAETLPFFSDFATLANASGDTGPSTLSAGTFGGDMAGEYRLAVPVTFGQNVTINHEYTLPADPYTISPDLFVTSHATGDYADGFFLLCVQGGLTRLGV